MKMWSNNSSRKLLCKRSHFEAYLKLLHNMIVSTLNWRKCDGIFRLFSTCFFNFMGSAESEGNESWTKKKKKKAALLNPVLPERTVGNFFGGERSMCSPLWASQNCQKMWIFCFQNSMRKRKTRNKWEGWNIIGKQQIFSLAPDLLMHYSYALRNETSL